MSASNPSLVEESNLRVLSIQSHTVSGYCGNKAAVFPLQLLGFDVDILNTVQFSNHTGYPSFAGGRLTAEEVQTLFDGLEKNELTEDYTHLLTGYIGNYSILEKIEMMVKKLKEQNPDLIFVCDTVMGDNGALYVAAEIVPLYRNIMRYAYVVTPNQFEAETLSEMKISSLEDTRQVAKKLHGLGTPNIVITSLKLPLKHVPQEIQFENESTDESLYCFTSQELPNGELVQHLISFPTYQGYFTGTGDLFSSLIVPRLQESMRNKTRHFLIEAVYRVVCSVNAITKKTWLYQQEYMQQRYGNEASEIKPNEAKAVRSCELRLIQSRKEIEQSDLFREVVKSVQV
ncbi:Ribokinase-like protein [Mycotypha africana]|uniref:Ribokinase-like protein n=1 Tax=Mycotypha africana TaxID=64632 RepID=UPI00230077B2|nr:Ribokinase-like protein [Mycotypha africana]KAI8982462.1 Ribokinase-like protein [Mycotypha africana]